MFYSFAAVGQIDSIKQHNVFAGLKCVCQLCANHTCETTADGACWNSVMLIDGKEETVKSCLSPSEMKGQVFCYSSRNVSKRNCCFTDFCNNETLHLHPGTILSLVNFYYLNILY